MTTAANQGDVAARRRTRTWLIASAAVVAGTVLGLVRIGGVGATNSLFAEDGTIFVTENTNNGTWTALTTPYNAYLHTVPRIAAALVGLFPVRWTAAGLALFSAGLVALLALVVYEASSSVIRFTHALRAVPRRGRSSSCPSRRRRCSTASRTCSGILIGAAGLCMLWRPRSRPLRVVGVLVIAAAALSQPLTVLLLPIVILRFRRDRRVDLFIGSWLIALCGYGLALVRTGVHRQDEPGAATIGPARAVEHFVVDVIGRGQYGFRWLDHSRNPLGVLLMGLSILTVAAAAFYVIKHRPATTPRDRDTRGHQRARLLRTGGDLTRRAPWVQRRAHRPPSHRAAGDPRCHAGTHARTAHVHTATWTIVALTALVLAVNLRVPTLRSNGPSWSSGLDQARTACATTDVKKVSILITPQGPGQFAWTADLPCSRIR